MYFGLRGRVQACGYIYGGGGGLDSAPEEGRAGPCDSIAEADRSTPAGGNDDVRPTEQVAADYASCITAGAPHTLYISCSPRRSDNRTRLRDGAIADGFEIPSVRLQKHIL